MIIQWIRLKEIAERLLAQRGERLVVNLHGSTTVENGLRAAVERDGNQVDVVLNLLYNKCLEDVFASLAHELAHVALDIEDHPLAFDQERQGLESAIKALYQEEQHPVLESAEMALNGLKKPKNSLPGRKARRQR